MFVKCLEPWRIVNVCLACVPLLDPVFLVIIMDTSSLLDPIFLIIIMNAGSFLYEMRIYQFYAIFREK
jgi:hypothetical protein